MVWYVWFGFSVSCREVGSGLIASAVARHFHLLLIEEEGRLIDLCIFHPTRPNSCCTTMSDAGTGNA
jgi:hypothetical protein